MPCLVRPDDRALLRVCGGGESGRPAGGRHSLRVHAARVDHGGRRRAGLPCGGSAKTIPAAEQHLPANLCPLIKSTYGYHVLRSNPFLEMADLVVGETTCDGKKKMYELMAESRPMYVLELPHKADDARCPGVLGAGIGAVPGLPVEALRHGRHATTSSARRSGC